MYERLSLRPRGGQSARRGHYLPHVDLLEDRLAPGDAMLSQVLGMSLLGNALASLDTAPALWNTPETFATPSSDLRLVQAEDAMSASEYALSPIVNFADQFAVQTTTLVSLEQAATDFEEFLTPVLTNPLDDGVFDTVSAASAVQARTLTAPPVQVVGDGSSAGSFGGGTLIGLVSETPQVVQANAGDLSQYAQLIVSTPTTPAIDPVVLDARNGNVPENFTKPEELDLSVLQNADHTRGAQFLADLRARMNVGGENGGGSDPGVTAGPGDPSAIGPLPVTRIEFNLGNTSFQPPGFPAPVEIEASVHFPTNLPGGPYPMIVFMHGRHATCYQGASAFLQWPCSAGRLSIPSFTGYDYIAPVLASWGFIVTSVGANGINAVDNNVQDLGMLARAQVIQRHLDNWNTWSTVGGGPVGIGNAFIGKVDLQNVGTMGHSRGGEGVVRHFVLNASLGSPYRINAVLPLAPVDFSRPQVGAAHQMIILPYCDGDVSDLQGMHFYDDARYTLGNNDFYYKTTVTAMGANHNYFNTIWTPGMFPAGTFNDSAATAYCTSGVAGSGRLTPVQQRAIGLAYIAGFFRFYNGADFQFFDYIVGENNALPPTVASFDIRVSSHSPFTSLTPGDYRRDVNRFTAANALTVNTLGGAVTTGGLVTYELCGGNAPQPIHCMAAEPAGRQPHTVPSARSTLRGMPQVRLVWDSSTAFYQNDLPAGSRDVSSYHALAFRVGLNYADTVRNPLGASQDFTVRLTDGAGNFVNLNVNWFSNPLAYPPGNPAAGTIPKLILNSARIPLSAYAVSGVDLTDIRSVRFSFDQTTRGHLLMSEMHFTLY